MFSQMLRTLIAVMTVGAVAISTVFAHEMTIKGTVEAVQPTRIQIKTGEEKKGQPPGR